jgi:hypothetical protein
MIRVTATGLHATVDGPAVYLDNWAIGDLAEGDPSRRRRFVEAIHSGIDLLFSVTNAAELSGPQGKSADVVREFLDEIGPRWFPARLDVTEVIKDEARGVRPEKACVDENFFLSHVADQMRTQRTLGEIIAVSDSLFRLGPVLDRVGPQRESISRGAAAFDEMIKTKMIAIHEKCKRDPSLLDRKFPVLPFHPARPACFVYYNLLRVMAVEAHSLKKGDGIDFCHAVVACAFSGFATLDARWKRRVRTLPLNRLARIYSGSELDEMVRDMELWVKNRAA